MYLSADSEHLRAAARLAEAISGLEFDEFLSIVEFAEIFGRLQANERVAILEFISALAKDPNRRTCWPR